MKEGVSIIETINKFDWLPYKIGEIVPSNAKFNAGSTCKVFKYHGHRGEKRWSIQVIAGMIDNNGNEVEGKCIRWKTKDDDNLVELCKKLEILFPEVGGRFIIADEKKQTLRTWNQREAIFAFADYLMQQERPITFSPQHQIAPVVELIHEFAEKYNLPELREGWQEKLNTSNEPQ